jgi:hypothetical protein
MQDTIYIRDERVLEAKPGPDSLHILLCREGERGAVRMHLNKVGYLAHPLCSIAGEAVRDD